MKPEKFTLLGRLVTHHERPRFVMLFTQNDAGGFDGKPAEWIDAPDAKAVPTLVRQAGDFFAANARKDWIQEAVIFRARELGLNSLAISKAIGGAVSDDHVRAYLTREKSMGSHKLQHVLSVLGLRLAE